MIMKLQSVFHSEVLLLRLIRRSNFTILLLVGILILLPAFRKDSRKPFKNYVLLVSLDGFRWDYNKIYNTPNLNKLAKDGVKADRMYSSFPTVTFPNHYSIATGLYPDHHGLINNSFPATDLGLFYRMGDCGKTRCQVSFILLGGI